MSPYRRNVVVGLTVLVAGLILGWMILQFGGSIASPFTEKQLPITLVTTRADGLSDGSPIFYRGVLVGRVSNVTRADDMITIYVQGLVAAAPPLPSNVYARVRTQGLIGSGAGVAIELLPGETVPTGRLTAGTTIKAEFVGLDIIPPEFADLATELRKTAQQFRESGVIGNLNQQITKAGAVLDSADALLKDPKLQADLKESLANLLEITQKANRVAGNLEKLTDNFNTLSTETKDAVTEARGVISKTEGHLDQLTAQLNDRLSQAGTLLEQFNAIAAKVDKGQGTAGQLVNDPRLYESLTATTQELAITIKDLKRLVEQWEQEGVTLKLR